MAIAKNHATNDVIAITTALPPGWSSVRRTTRVHVAKATNKMAIWNKAAMAYDFGFAARFTVRRLSGRRTALRTGIAQFCAATKSW